MKKLVATILALAMILSLGTIHFAAETTVTFANMQARTLNGYKLLDLSVSLKSDAHHTAHDGEHTDDCYNYAYTVNEKYLAILQAEVHAKGGNYLWPDGVIPSADQITEQQILDYFKNQTSDNGDVTGTMRQVADRLYRAILLADPAIDPDAPAITDTADIEHGYWLFADVSDMAGDEDANSLIMVDTKGASDITITPKVSIPTLEKKVKDIDDSEDGLITDNPWYDTADYDIGDNNIPFKVTVTLPSNYQAYFKYDETAQEYKQHYSLIVHDTMSAGLTLTDGTFKVLAYASKYKADVDTDLNDATADVTAFFNLKTTDLDGDSFEVVCENIFAITGVTINKDTAFVIYYEGTLTEDAVIGATGNPNEAYLEFSNDPYDASSTGMTQRDVVEVYTYKLVINKVDNHGHELAGAGFTLFKKDVNGNYVQIGTEQGGEGSTLTTFSWKGLDDGDYRLEETTVPDGYNQLEAVLFSVSATHSETADDPELLTLDGGIMGTGDITIGAITNDIVNKTGTILPETGAEGTFMLIGGGAVLVLFAAVFMVTRKKMSIYED